MARVLSTKRLAVAQRYSKRLQALMEKGYDVEPLKTEIKKIKGINITKKGNVTISESAYSTGAENIRKGLEQTVKNVKSIQKERQRAKKEAEKAAKRAAREAKKAEQARKRKAAAEKRAAREAIREAEKEKRLTNLEKNLNKRINNLMEKYNLEAHDVDKSDLVKAFTQVDGVSTSESGDIVILDKKNFSYDRELALRKIIPSISSLEKEAKNELIDDMHSTDEEFNEKLKKDESGLYKSIIRQKVVEKVKKVVDENVFKKYYEVFEPGTDGAVAEMYQDDDREDPLKYDKAFEKLRELGRIYREEGISDSYLNVQKDLDKDIKRIKRG